MRKPFSLRRLTRLSELLLLLAVMASLVACQSPVIETPNVVAPATIRPPAATPELTAGETGQPPLPSPSSPPLMATSTVSPTQGALNGAANSPLSTPVVTSTIPTTTTVSELDGDVVDGYRVVNVYPHDRAAFTEGLVYVDGILFEGTGLDNQSNPPGQSVLEKKDLATGQALQSIKLAPEFFGEGVTVMGNRVYQLTWKERTGFVYDKDTLQPLETFTISSDGWGLTHDGSRLIRSDGTSTLFFLDPTTLQETGRVDVRDGQGEPVANLNELEYINGEVYANVWLTDTIVRIDPATGKVLGRIDLTGLLPPEDRAQRVDVLNGIAYDAAEDRLFVTGKWWPKLFEIDVIPAN
jgi:glutaminyl-peptide cyclotransferase